MRPTAKINTKCLGWYYYDDSWHRVKGRVIGASKKVLVQGGGLAYINSKVIINTARGGLIDEDALIRAIGEETIAGAALDVFEKEPYSGKLLEFDNVLLTPHIGSYTEETRMVMEMETVENLINALLGVETK